LNSNTFMKKIFFLAFFNLLIGTLFAQKQELAPYLKNPVLPDFKILQKDSATWFTKANLKSGKPVMIMLFSPDCEHCQLQTKDILKKIKELGDLQIVMATFQPMEKMRKFHKEYGISAYPNIHMGRDESFFFGPYYVGRSIPFLAIYDRNRKLIKVYDGGAPAEKISAAIK
jgi:thiol-disulfide isomerase/thioredoxin